MKRYIFVLFSYYQLFLGHRRLFKRSKKSPYLHPNYSPFHETLPNSSLLTHCISVRFYEMGDTKKKYVTALCSANQYAYASLCWWKDL